jgi:hypothetical protein
MQTTPYIWNYLPLALHIAGALGIAGGMVVASFFVGRHRNYRVKLDPYECGMDPVGDARGRFSVREMQAQMEQKLAATIVEAESGGGMVSVRMNGKKEVLRLKIEPTALGATTGDIELLEDLIAAAINEAGRRADEAIKSSVSSLMSGLNLPGLE